MDRSSVRSLPYTLGVRTHAWIDDRSLTLHTAIAARLRADPTLLDKVRANLDRWLAVSPQSALEEWRQLLDSTPLPQLLDVLQSREERSARLRQSSPFAGVLSPEERTAIFRAYAARRS